MRLSSLSPFLRQTAHASYQLGCYDTAVPILFCIQTRVVKVHGSPILLDLTLLLLAVAAPLVTTTAQSQRMATPRLQRSRTGLANQTRITSARCQLTGTRSPAHTQGACPADNCALTSSKLVLHVWPYQVLIAAPPRDARLFMWQDGCNSKAITIDASTAGRLCKVPDQGATRLLL